MNHIGFLIKKRDKPKISSYQWFKNWAKRILQIKALILLVFRVNSLKLKGVSIGSISIIGKININGKGKNLFIGNEVFIASNVHFTTHDMVKIGDKVVINNDCKFYTASHDIDSPEWSMTKAPIIINDFAWVASGAIILPGVTIGKGAVIGAGSVVSRDVLPYDVVAGNPAKVIKHRKKQDFTYSPVRFVALYDAWLSKKVT